LRESQLGTDATARRFSPEIRIGLIGLPGVGKSTVGRRLARRLDLAFVDSDAAIEQRLGMRIRDFFETEGEARFRDAETDVLDELTRAPATVVATGGGVVLRPQNRQVLRERTFCVYLRAHPDALFQRLRRDTKRPLLQVADPAARLRELHQEREPLYRDAAALEVETRGKSLEMIVDAIVFHLPPADLRETRA
jgi:shikimate kinase